MKKIFLFLLLTSFIPLLTWAQDDNEGNETPESIKQREMFIHERRAGGPHMLYTPNAYENALFQKSTMVKDKDLQGSQTRMISWQTANPKGLFYSRTGNNYISGLSLIHIFIICKTSNTFLLNILKEKKNETNK